MTSSEVQTHLELDGRSEQLASFRAVKYPYRDLVDEANGRVVVKARGYLSTTAGFLAIP